MKTKLFFIFTACCIIALALTGCRGGTVQSAVSRLGDDISETVSRVESALDPNSSDGFPDEREQSSMPDYASSQGGGINSGDEDIENGTESRIGDDSSYLDDAESDVSEDSKDI